MQTTKYFRRIRTQTFSTLIEYTPGKEFDSSCLLVCFDYLISFRVRQGQLINSFNPISSILSLTEIWTIEFYKNKKLNDCRTLPSGSSSFTTSISSFSQVILKNVFPSKKLSFYHAFAEKRVISSRWLLEVQCMLYYYRGFSHLTVTRPLLDYIFFDERMVVYKRIYSKELVCHD